MFYSPENLSQQKVNQTHKGYRNENVRPTRTHKVNCDDQNHCVLVNSQQVVT